MVDAAAGKGAPATADAGQLLARRLGALALLVGAVGIGVWLATGAIGGNEKKATTTVDNQPLRIVFPEGFTRAQMARRITAVDKIARTKRHVDPVLSASSYLRATRRIRVSKEFLPNVENGAAGGLPLPGPVRLHPGDDLEAARQGSALGLSAQIRAGPASPTPRRAT